MSSVVNTSYDSSIKGNPAAKLAILHTDILGDFDDADALVALLNLLKEGKIDRLIIITAGKGAHLARAIFCGFLVKEMLGCDCAGPAWIPALPVLIYQGCEQGSEDSEDKCNYLDPELVRLGMQAIPNVRDGAKRIRNEVKAAGEVLLLVAAPVDKDLLALELHKFPRVKLCIMTGAFASAFDGMGIDNREFAEYNAAGNPQGLADLGQAFHGRDLGQAFHGRDLGQAFHGRMLMCPLDSCALDSRVPYWKDVLPNCPKLYRHAYKKWVASMKTKDKTKVLQGLRDGEASNIKFDLRALYDGLRWIGWFRRGIEVSRRTVSVLPGGQTICQYFDSPAPSTTPRGSFCTYVSFRGCGYFQTWAREYLTAGSQSARAEEEAAATRVQKWLRNVAARAKKSESPKRERGSSDDSSSAAKKAEGEEGPSLKKARN